MSKANRLRRAHARHEGNFAQQQAATRQRQADGSRERLDSERLRVLLAPDTEAVRVREMLESTGTVPCPADFAGLLLDHGSTPERLARVATEMLSDAPTALSALTFAAAVARHGGDGAEADRLLDRAFDATRGDPAMEVDLMGILPGHGRVADALEMLGDQLLRNPDDAGVIRHFSAVMGMCYERDCGPRATAAARRFADRSALLEFQDAVTTWLRGDNAFAYKAVVGMAAANALRLVSGQPGWDDGATDLLADLAAEFGLTAGPDGVAAGTDDNALLAFADDPQTPPDLAARAREWRTGIRYGLWRIDDAKPGPGLVCTDILSGRTRYVEFPARIRDQLVRHAVWYGGVVPVSGIWRSTGLGARLSPAEADAAADLILGGIAADGPGGLEQAGKELGQSMKFGEAAPHGVAVDYGDPLPDAVALRASTMAGAAIPRVLGETVRYRALVPGPRNSSDEPACLIAAWLTVTDPAALLSALLDRDDFEAHPAGSGLVGWLESAPPGAPKITLGTLRFSPPGATVLAQVNSCARFACLCDLLSRLDAGLTVRREKRIDPELHTAWPDDMITRQSVSADGWEMFWLDSPLAVLGNRSPRQAAGTSRLPQLMTLLRQFEYQARLLALDGRSGLDVGLLRRELGVEEL